MKILYVTYLWTALEDVLYKGEKEPKGMPAFFNVLEKLAEKNCIDILAYDNTASHIGQTPEPCVEWMKSIRFYYVPHEQIFRGVLKPFSETVGFFKLRKEVDKLVKRGSYDFIYGHGPISEAANLVAKKYNIPFGQRRYGDMYYSLIKSKGLLYSFLSQPINYYSYRAKKRFMIATRDGSCVDKAYLEINKKRRPYPIYNWLNGTDLTIIPSGEPPSMPSDNRPYLLYIARIVEWKRQLLALDLLKSLASMGLNCNLYFAGQIGSENYYRQLMDQASRMGLSDSVKYLGVINKSDMCHYTRNALSCLSFYTPCNLGNVLIEYMTFGGTVISMNDGSLDGIINNSENGFLVNNMKEAANIVADLYNNPGKCILISSRAQESARKLFVPWDNRVQLEISLIEDAVDSRNHYTAGASPEGQI